MSIPYKNNLLSVNDREISLDTKNDNNDAIVKKKQFIKQSKKRT